MKTLLLISALWITGCANQNTCEYDNEWLFYRIEKYEIQLAQGDITLEDFAMYMRDLERLDKMKRIKYRMDHK